MTDSTALLTVKRLLQGSQGARDFVRQAMAAGFEEATAADCEDWFEPAGKDWIGVRLKDRGCTFVLQVIESKGPDKIWSLVFKDGEKSAQALVDKGELAFVIDVTPPSTEPTNMARHYCAIFDKKDGRLASIGLWALDPVALDSSISAFNDAGTIDGRLTSDLLSLAQPTLQFLTKAKTRRVSNTTIDVGNGVRFEGGVFIMLIPYKSPNEELADRACSTRFVLQVQDGVPLLKRTGQSPHPVMRERASSVQTENKRWWKFWK